MNNVDHEPQTSADVLYIGDMNIAEDKCSNGYIRNVLKQIRYHLQQSHRVEESVANN